MKLKEKNDADRVNVDPRSQPQVFARVINYEPISQLKVMKSDYYGE